MSKNTGGRAFPQSMTTDSEGLVWVSSEIDTQQHGGMTLRDYFAAKVAATCLNKTWDYCNLHNVEVENVYVMSATMAYELADAMLAERDK